MNPTKSTINKKGNATMSDQLPLTSKIDDMLDKVKTCVEKHEKESEKKFQALLDKYKSLYEIVEDLKRELEDTDIERLDDVDAFANMSSFLDERDNYPDAMTT